VIGPACEERGADLFAAARDGDLPPDLARHLDACDACRAEYAALRRLATDLRLADPGLAPRPATREALLREIASPAAAPAPRRLPRANVIPMWIPIAAALAGAAALILVMSRPDTVVKDGALPVTVSVTPLWGDAALDGLVAGGVAEGSVLSASEVSSIRLGSPFHAEVVLGKGAQLKVLPAGPALEVEKGIVYVDSLGLTVPLQVHGFDANGARFSMERLEDGNVSFVVEFGSLRGRANSGEFVMEGPCRYVTGTPGKSLPAEPSDATAWFSYPLLTLERRPSLTLGEKDLVLELRPSVARTIRIAPWDRFDPLFSLRVHRPDGSLVEIPVKAEMLRRPAPDADSEGAFLLGPEIPYTIYVDPAALGLPGGKVRLEAVYSAGRPGGLWRGVRTSNALEFESK
jgi:anti-sigma factor RsiW